MTDEPTGVLAFDRQRAAMAVENVTGSEKCVLLVLTIMANTEGVAWPSIAQIAARASIGRRTAFEALDGLAARKLIRRDPVPGKGARYTVLPDWCATRTGAPLAPVRLPHSTGAPPAPKQPRNSHKKETSSLLSTRATRNAIETLPDLPAGASDQQWADYVEMRVAMAGADKKRPWTAATARKAIEKLQRMAAAGHDPGAVLDQSVLNSWQGLFPVKDDQDGRQRQPVATTRRGPRPDPALDMLYAARAAEEAECADRDREADREPWPSLPSYRDD